MKVIYSKIALISLEEIVEFLQVHWTFRELQVLNEDIEKFVVTLEDKVITYPTLEFDSKLSYTLIGKKQIKVFFEVKEDSVEILLFWANKKDPRELKDLLKR